MGSVGKQKDLFPLLLFGIVLAAALVALLVIGKVFDNIEYPTLGGQVRGEAIAVGTEGIEGYAVPWDPLISATRPYLTVEPKGANTFSVAVTQDQDVEQQYVYRYGWYSNTTSAGKRWIQFPFTTAPVSGTPWIRGKANYTLTSRSTDSEEYVIAFVCRRYPGREDFICGPTGSTPDPEQKLWTIQSFDPAAQTCTPSKTCSSYPGQCGLNFSNGCTNTLHCGCSSGTCTNTTSARQGVCQSCTGTACDAFTLTVAHSPLGTTSVPITQATEVIINATTSKTGTQRIYIDETLQQCGPKSTAYSCVVSKTFAPGHYTYYATATNGSDNRRNPAAGNISFTVTCAALSEAEACGDHDCGNASNGCGGIVYCGDLANGACPSTQYCSKASGATKGTCQDCEGGSCVQFGVSVVHSPSTSLVPTTEVTLTSTATRQGEQTIYVNNQPVTCSAQSTAFNCINKSTYPAGTYDYYTTATNGSNAISDPATGTKSFTVQPASCTQTCTTTGAKRCSGNTVQTCTGGCWVNGETCTGQQNTCSNGACVCTPKTAAQACGNDNCGTASDGCDATVNCGANNGGCPQQSQTCNKIGSNTSGTCDATCTPNCQTAGARQCVSAGSPGSYQTCAVVSGTTSCLQWSTPATNCQSTELCTGAGQCSAACTATTGQFCSASVPANTQAGTGACATGQGTCWKCASNYNLQNGQCVATCPAGTCNPSTEKYRCSNNAMQKCTGTGASGCWANSNECDSNVDCSVNGGPNFVCGGKSLYCRSFTSPTSGYSWVEQTFCQSGGTSTKPYCTMVYCDGTSAQCIKDPANDNNGWGTPCSASSPCNSQTGYCGNSCYCPDDGKSCTTESCSASGVCQHTVNANSCLINNQCVGASVQDSSNVCKECRPSVSNSAYSNKDDGTSCTLAVGGTGACRNGVCTVTVPTGLLTLTTAPRCDDANSLVDLSWNSLAGATSYTIVRGGFFVATVDGSTTSWTSPPQTFGSVAWWQVRAANSAGEGSRSNLPTATALTCQSSCPTNTGSRYTDCFTSQPSGSTPLTQYSCNNGACYQCPASRPIYNSGSNACVQCNAGSDCRDIAGCMGGECICDTGTKMCRPPTCADIATCGGEKRCGGAFAICGTTTSLNCACPGGEVCNANHYCTAPCPSGINCADYGMACDTSSSSCVFSCLGGEQTCNGICTDMATPENCGWCGNNCYNQGMSYCTDGQCVECMHDWDCGYSQTCQYGSCQYGYQ